MTTDQKTTGFTKLTKFAENTLVGLAVGWFLLLCYFLSDGGPSFLDYVFYVFGGLSLMLMIVISLAFLFLYLKTNGLQLQTWYGQTWLGLLRRPVIYLLIFSFLGYLIIDYPASFIVRFKLSQQALENFAEHPTLDHDPSTFQWVGLFPLREVYVTGSAVRIIVTRCNVLDDCGFVFSPDGEPPILGEDHYIKIPFAKGWYHWHRSW